MINLPITQLADTSASSSHANKPLLIGIYALMLLIIAVIVYAVVKSKQAKPKDKGFLVSLGRMFDPSKPGSVALSFVLVFAIVGGGYMAYKSFAATCTAYNYGSGGSGYCVQQIQSILNGAFAGSNYRGGAYLTVDGSYGTLTTNQVKAFQTFTTYLSVDGKVGPNTWSAFCAQMRTDYAARGHYSGRAYTEIVSGYTASKNAGC